MQFTWAMEPGSVARLDILAEVPDVASARARAVERVRREVTVRGYRPGFGPPDRIARAVPGRVREVSLAILLPELFDKAVTLSGIRPLGPTPEFEVDVDWLAVLATGEDPPKFGKPTELAAWAEALPITVKLTVRVEVAPTVELPDYKAFRLPRLPGETDEGWRNRAMMWLVENMPTDPPKSAVKAEKERLRYDLHDRIRAMGLNVRVYAAKQGLTTDQVEADLEREAGNAVKARMLWREVAEREAVGLTEAEVQSGRARLAQARNSTPEAMEEWLAGDPARKEAMLRGLLNEKVIAMLLAWAGQGDGGPQLVGDAPAGPPGLLGPDGKPWRVPEEPPAWSAGGEGRTVKPGSRWSDGRNGCHWGDPVAAPRSAPEPCREKAVSVLVVHRPNGLHAYRTCERHREGFFDYFRLLDDGVDRDHVWEVDRDLDQFAWPNEMAG